MTCEPYLSILVKQYANLRSNNEAERIIKAIDKAVFGLVSEKDYATLNKLMPYAMEKRTTKIFFHRADTQAEFDIDTAIARLQKILSLSSSQEAKQYLSSYFKAINLLAGEVKSNLIWQTLPSQLQAFASNLK